MKLKAIDLFCGAGGTSTGLVQACEQLGHTLELFAVNHWNTAVETHALNHPWANHLCRDLDSIDPRLMMGRGELDVLVASPECTHHSNAAGGRPKDDQSRATAWHVMRFADALAPKVILIENVKEFMDWGPLDEAGNPIAGMKGTLFNMFTRSLELMGYNLKYEVAVAANYGDPTTRERLFIVAGLGVDVGIAPHTHSETGAGGLPKWIPASDIVDWSLPCNSIFNRKRPLVDNTMRRIAKGIFRFVLDSPDPFIVTLRHGGEGFRGQDLNRPLRTVTGSNGFAVVTPHIQKFYGGVVGRPVTDPLSTITTTDHQGLACAFLNRHFGEGTARGLDRPCPTVLQSPGHTSITTAGLSPAGIPEDNAELVRAFLLKYYGRGAPGQRLQDPAPTVRTKSHLGLVTVRGKDYCISDIGLRMLQPHELSLAQGFPADYQFAGTSKAAKTKQIGNAVPVGTATNLLTTLIQQGITASVA